MNVSEMVAERNSLIVDLRNAERERDSLKADNAALREQVEALSKPIAKSDAAIVAKQLRDWSDADLRAESKVRDVSKANREATLGYIAASVLESLDRTTDILAARAERAEADNAALRPLLSALRHIDWMQIILNQSAPCCHIEDDGRFCGRAEKWAGHEHFHKFISLEAAIDAAMREGKP